MIPQKQYFERLQESVMFRTVEGKINFWNPSAEKLYGWGKDDAVGKVSHHLLQTQFPKPLEEIEAELSKKGRWQGRLVHATRDGRWVVVESRWSLDPTRQPAAVVEINAPAAGSNHSGSRPPEDVDVTETTSRNSAASAKLTRTTRSQIQRVLQAMILAAIIGVAFLWVLYGLFGRLAIHGIHAGHVTAIADRLMAGRAFTPVENYYFRTEELLWSGTLTILALASLAWLLTRSLGGTLLAGFSTLFASFFLFSVLEVYPPLIKTLRLDAISPYFAYRGNQIPDDTLIYRERPFNRTVLSGFKGSNYSPLFDVDVVPWRVEWQTDHNGFRNSGKIDSADIVVLGDSYMDYGSTVSDTFPSLLQERLSGVTVVNLGKSGYGPFQYLEVFKRVGLQYKPRYALFAFYEGNDILDIRNYTAWKEGRTEALGDLPHIAWHRSFLGRYRLALKTTARRLNKTVLTWVHMGFGKNPLLGEQRPKIHPDLALIELGQGELHKMHIADHNARQHQALSERENWVALESILREFKELCEAHQVMPIVLYIPSSSHIYAQFSTDASGGNWLRIRDHEVATKQDVEKSVAGIVKAVGIDFISLSPTLEHHAREGKLLYFRLDPHWTREGTAIAAAFVADALKADFNISAAAH